MQLNFCTYFDVNYFSRGLALFHSLKRHCTSFQLHCLCLDDLSYQAISEICSYEPSLTVIKLKEIENWDKDLLQAKSNRSRIEYYFTLTPVLPLYILHIMDSIDSITYLDADLYFYSNPACLFEELGKGSIYTIEHRFPPQRNNDEIYGRFNVQCQIFKNNDEGKACLEHWRSQCIEWCYDRLEGDRFADQKYLDKWPETYDGLVISKNLGAGLAPWNIDGFNITITSDGESLLINNQPIVFFHFHALKRLTSKLFFTGLSNYRSTLSRPLINWLYKPYITELEQNQDTLHQLLCEAVMQKSNLRDSSSKLKEIFKALIRRDIISIQHASSIHHT